MVTSTARTATKPQPGRPARTKTSPKKSHATTKHGVPEPDEFIELDLMKGSLGYAIKLAQVRASEVLYKTLGPDSLTPARMTALSIVATTPGISQAALADRLRIARPSVVKVVDTLESLGLIERQPGSDRRSYALAPTPLGQNELREIRQRLRGYEEAITQRMTATERTHLMALLAKVA